jgi:hypothetical protein
MGMLVVMLVQAPAAAQTKSRILRMAGTAGLIGAAVLLDPLVRVESADGGDRFMRRLARVSGQVGDYGTVLLGLGGTYLFSGQQTRQAVQRVARAAAVTSVVTRVIKIYVGRARPSSRAGAAYFEPVQLQSRYNSFPSGHTALAFAMAQAIDDEIDNRFAEIGLYTASALIGWSRVREDKHWLSDVTAGAIEGIAITRMLRDGHFFSSEPQFALTPNGLAVIIPVDF